MSAVNDDITDANTAVHMERMRVLGLARRIDALLGVCTDPGGPGGVTVDDEANSDRRDTMVYLAAELAEELAEGIEAALWPTAATAPVAAAKVTRRRKGGGKGAK